jgi:hypothetical protein
MFFFFLFFYYRHDFYTFCQLLAYELKINNHQFLKTLSSLYSLFSSFICSYFFSKNTKIIGKKNYYDITYFFRDSSYTLRFPFKKGPRPFYNLKITTEKDNMSIDVTEKILPFLGPDFNWHHQIYFPLLLGFSSLSFSVDDKRIATFSSHHPLPSIPSLLLEHSS